MNIDNNKSFTGWKAGVVYSLLGGSLALVGYTAYESMWQAKTGYGKDYETLSILDTKDPRALTGGDLTHFKFGNISFEQEPYNLHWKLAVLFDHGDGVFERPFTEAKPNHFRYDADGLGPLYNETSCEGCHIADGRAAPPQKAGEPLEGLLFRVSIPGKDMHGGPNPHPIYGGQLADKSIAGHKPEVVPVITYTEQPGQYPDGTAFSLRAPSYDFNLAFYGPLGEDAMFSPRVAPAMIGMGLLDAIDSEQIAAKADPKDINSDGITGKVNMVWDAEAKTMAVGKYGWKGETPTLKQQIADAAVNDMGISNELFPMQTCTKKQGDCNKALHGTSDDDLELTKEQLDQLVVYLEFLAIPGRDPIDHPETLRGEEIFKQANCNGCHTDTWITGNTQRQWRLHNQKIHPYTDLLLHDMGEGLADNRPSFDATGTEWRTAPLWGIGMTKRVNGHTFFLHDGRARNLEEAILWHGGEAENAKQFFMAQTLKDRKALLAFLRTI